MTDKEFCGLLGEEIQRRRERLGMTQIEMADKAKIHRNTLWRYEAGRDIPMVIFMRVCKVLDVPMIELLESVLPDARKRIAEANGLEIKGN